MNLNRWSNRMRIFHCSILCCCLAFVFIIGPQSLAAPSTYDKMERDYYDWPASLLIGEQYVMKPINLYYRNGQIIEREPLGGTWNYISANEQVIKVVGGKTLLAVGAGQTTLQLKLTVTVKDGTRTTTTTTTYSTTKKIAVAVAEHEVERQWQRTAADIKWAYLLAKPMHVGTPFLKSPRIQSPFFEGQLHSGFIQDGLRMTNFVRYLAGLPANLVVDPMLNRQALHGAVLNAHWNELDHTPAKPTSMNEAFYTLAYRSTSSSNLSYGVNQLDEQVLGFMDDLGLNNVSEVGHRRWILNPPLKKTGFGIVKSADNEMYGAMQVFDESASTTTKVKYNMITWPAPGSFPISFFDAKAVWSVSLNPAIYDASKTSAIKVTLTRKHDGRQWTLDSRNREVSEEGPYFGVSTKGMGIPFAIMFRPDNVDWEHGDIYHVKLSGIQHRTLGEQTLEYEVSWFDIDQVRLTNLFNYRSSAEVTRNMANGEIRIYLNGEQKIYDQAPLQRNGSVLVPLRGILENLGASIQFQNATQVITATKGQTKIVLQVGKNSATVNGKQVNLSQPAMSNNGRVFVPLRFVSESLAAQVTWEPAYPSVVIKLAQ